MPLNIVAPPYPVFTDRDGTPLENGYVYLGNPGQDAETNPIQVFWDSALTIPAVQPIRTVYGYLSRNGTPAKLYANDTVSMTVKNVNQEVVFSSLTNLPFDPSTSARVEVQDFTGDGTTTQFTLIASPASENNTQVFINGVYQNKDGYSLTGNVLTFSEAPPAVGSSIEVVSFETFTIGETDSSFVSYLPAGVGAQQTTVQAKLRETVSVKDFGAVGDGVTDDTAAIIAAMGTGGRTIYMPPGTYLSNFGNADYQPNYILNIPSGTHFIGAGESTVWRNFTDNSGTPVGRDSLGAIGTDSGSASVWSEDISFRNIKFYGWSETNPTVDQGNHLIFLSSVKRVIIENCYFVAPRGDGIYIASGFGGGASNERHNYDVVIKNCFFDGVNNKNRQGISVIDGTNVLIDGCTFVNFTDTTMPGSIDFEPDEDYSVIRNATVTNCSFSNGNGNRGLVTVSTGSSENLENVSITNNNFDGNTAIYINTETSITGGALPSNPHNITIANNRAYDCSYFLLHQYGSLWGVNIIGNLSYAVGSSTGRIAFGTSTSASTNKDIIFAENQFTCNATIALLMYNNWENCTINNNTFRGATTLQIRIGATGSGESSQNISIHDNAFFGTPSQGIVLHQSDTKNPLTNTYYRNYAPASVTHGFAATMTDFTGSTTNQFTEATLPNEFPYGVHKTAIESGSIYGSGTDFGTITTYRESSYGASYVWQMYKPATGANADNLSWRTATSATAWGSWYTVTGV